LPFEKFAGEMDLGQITRPRDPVHAGSGAVFDDVIQAMPEIAFAGNGGMAGAEVEFFLEEIERVAERARMGEGAEIPGTVVLAHPGELKAGERIVQVDFDEQKPLVVAETDIVARPIFLDEFSFEKEGFGLRFDGMRFDVPNAVDEGAGFAVGGHLAGGMEILTHPFGKIPGFADINHAVQPVLE
jgi:hypothetical protein